MELTSILITLLVWFVERRDPRHRSLRRRRTGVVPRRWSSTASIVNESRHDSFLRGLHDSHAWWAEGAFRASAPVLPIANTITMSDGCNWKHRHMLSLYRGLRLFSDGFSPFKIWFISHIVLSIDTCFDGNHHCKFLQHHFCLQDDVWEVHPWTGSILFHFETASMLASLGI